jgi:hypothetical protein
LPDADADEFIRVSLPYKDDEPVKGADLSHIDLISTWGVSRTSDGSSA